MHDPRDFKLDLSSAHPAPAVAPPKQPPRPYLSVLFNCCHVYQRIYRNNDQSAYEGRCPRCGRAVRFKVAAGGTDERFFVVD